MSYPSTKCRCTRCYAGSDKFWQHVAGALVVLLLVLATVLTTQARDSTLLGTLPACVEEDGSGQDYMCMWTDPDTGNKYVNNAGM